MHGKQHPLPAFPGFEHIKRSWNTVHESYMARIKPGEYYVTKHDEGILTLLGSCISACIRDRVSGIGGMNHFMLPIVPGHEPVEWAAAGLGAATRYGNHAMEHLINEIMKNANNGCKRENLEVKIFGGGNLIKNMTDIGNRNILFVRDYLKIERMQVAVEDVGDIYPRTVIYFPSTGLVRVKCLRTMHIKSIYSQENKYMENVADKPVAGDIELF
jgi:chemotaxis protein CheD